MSLFLRASTEGPLQSVPRVIDPPNCSVVPNTPVLALRLLVGAHKPNPDKPKGEQHQRPKRQHHKNPGSSQPHRKYALLSEEERDGRDEPTEAHPPQVAYQALGAAKSAAQQHAHVARCAQEGQRAKEKVRPSRALILDRRLPAGHFHTPDKVDGREGERDQRWDPTQLQASFSLCFTVAQAVATK